MSLQRQADAPLRPGFWPVFVSWRRQSAPSREAAAREAAARAQVPILGRSRPARQAWIHGGDARHRNVLEGSQQGYSMIGNREIAKVIHEVERAIVAREDAADAVVIGASRWEETPPAYQETRTQAVHAYKEGGVVDIDALDAGVFRAIVDALK
jgi:hypothetical protein